MDRDIEVDKFAAIFRGNVNAYGGDDGFAVKRPVSRKVVYDHLAGKEGIGIYPIRMNGLDASVHWGCCDIDTGDWSEAYMLATALRGMGLKPFIERSRSKGWHIWLFAEGWLPAKVMRRCLKVAYMAIDLPAKEANPKQETLNEGQLGNYVRLPYKGVFRTPDLERQVIMRDWSPSGDGEPCPLSDFLHSDLHTPTEVFEKWAAKYYEPPKRNVEFAAGDVNVERVIVNLPPATQKFIRQGPKKDRSAGMVALAHQLRKSGATPSEAMSVLGYVDSTWGKGYMDRSNGESFIEDILLRAYG